MEMDEGMKYVYRSVFAGWYTSLTRGEVMRSFLHAFYGLWLWEKKFLFVICCRYAAEMLADFVC